jgi:glycine oxidase
LANEPLARLEVESGAAVAAVTPFRHHKADAFVLAAGAWSAGIPGLPKEIATSVKPMKGEMIALERPASSPFPGHVVWGRSIYAVPRRNQLLIGATVADAGFDTRPTKAARDWLRSRADALMPALKDWVEAEHWAGLRPGSADELPLLGITTVGRLYAATGQYRNGILFAPAIADAISRLVLEHKVPPEIVAFDPRRFS